MSMKFDKFWYGNKFISFEDLHITVGKGRSNICVLGKIGDDSLNIHQFFNDDGELQMIGACYASKDFFTIEDPIPQGEHKFEVLS